MGLEKIIEISHKIADPYIKSAEAWKWATKVSAALLALSIIANICLVLTKWILITKQLNFS